MIIKELKKRIIIDRKELKKNKEIERKRLKKQKFNNLSPIIQNKDRKSVV